MKKIIRKIFLPLVLLGALTGKAQTTWYFGQNGGLKFTGSGTAPLTGCQMGASSEGSSVLVDKNNNVIMYSDGIKIWNGSHVQQNVNMPLMGHLSSTQGVAIVPIPNSSKAFIFTVTGAEIYFGKNNGTNGLRVSLATIVNFGTEATPNYGIGINNNSAEYNYNLSGVGEIMSERIAVSSDGMGGYWVVTHGVGIYGNTATENKFYSYHVTCGTTNPASLVKVTSTISGYTSHFMDQMINNNGAGQLKFTTDGTKLGCTLPFLGYVPEGDNVRYNPLCQLYNFNKTTGIITPYVEFNLNFQGAAGSLTNDGAAYGFEFSPDGNYAYVTSVRSTSAITSMRSRIHRYNITSGNASTITGSRNVLPVSYDISNSTGTPTGTSFVSLMLGPDNKIYISKTAHNQPSATTLDVITNPNASNYLNVGMSGGAVPIGGNSQAGLALALIMKPSTIPSVSSPAWVCKGASITFNTSYSGVSPASYLWVVYGSDAAGNPINSSGNIQNSPIYSYYFKSSSTLGEVNEGPSPATVTPYGIATSANCGQYYSMRLTLTDVCGNYLYSNVTTTGIRCNDPSFTLAAHTSYPGYFTIKATPNDLVGATNPGFGYCWFVQDLNGSTPIFTMNNLSNWWIGNATPNEFRDFDHVANPNYINDYSSLPAGVPQGKFLYNHTYRITRGTWDATCSWNQYSQIKSVNPNNGINEVIFTEDKNAPDLSYLVDQKMTGIAPVMSKTDLFAVYPNPSNGLFTVELNNEDKATMQVFDITGKIIKTVQLNKNDYYTLDLSGHAKGAYMIKMNGVQQQLQKIIVE